MGWDCHRDAPSPFGSHSRLTIELAHRFATAIENTDCDATVLSEIDWIISEHTVVRPDVLIVCGREPERHVEETPPVVVEVLSDNTRSRDLNEKQEICCQQGVSYYIVVDPAESELIVFRLERDAYQPIKLSEEIVLQICDDCDVVLRTDNLFR